MSDNDLVIETTSQYLSIFNNHKNIKNKNQKN